MPAVTAAIVVLDALLAAAAFTAAFKIRSSSSVLSPTAWAWSQAFVPYAGILYFAVVARTAMLWYGGSYRFMGGFSYSREAIKVFKAVGVSSLLIVAWAFLFRGGFAFREFSYSRSVFVLDFLIALALILTLHLGLRWVQSAFRSRGINLQSTLVVGSGREALQTISELRERPALGYSVVGIATSAEIPGSERASLENRSGVPVVGSSSQLADLVRELEIQEVIITDNSLDTDCLFASMMQLGRQHRVEFRFAPTPLDLLPQKTSVEQIGVLPMVTLFREPLSDPQRFVKRAMDLLIAGVSLAVLAPAWAVIAMLIRADSRGPILFRQERVGMDGRIFLCYKFRTMAADAAPDIHREAYEKNIGGDPSANAGDPAVPVYGKVKNDPRITRFGRSLRRSSLDELPQLLNVLRGDMSIVGPRPPIPYEVESYDIWHRKRLDMRPGITGLWQVSGRNRLTFDEMVRADLYYIENWSPWLDLKIIMLTLPAMLRGDGAG